MTIQLMIVKIGSLENITGVSLYERQKDENFAPVPVAAAYFSSIHSSSKVTMGRVFQLVRAR